MATSTISNTLTSPSGTALSGVRVVAKLMPCPGFRTDTFTEVARMAETTTNASGEWSLTLEENANISPADTYYEIYEYVPTDDGGPHRWFIEVGTADSTLAGALITALPDTATSNFLTQAAADARYSVVLPAGMVAPYAGASAPSGWLLCDGAVVSRTTYADLFTAIGTTFNTGGEAGTDFRLPNLKGKVPVGLDSADTDFDALGEARGAKTHTLTLAETPSHDHGGQSGLPTGPPSAGRYGDWTGAGGAVGWATVGVSGQSNNYSEHRHSITAAGGGGAHNNIQPSLVLNYIIRT